MRKRFCLGRAAGRLRLSPRCPTLLFLRVKETARAAASTHEFTVEVEGKLPMETFSGTIYIRTDDSVVSGNKRAGAR